MKKIWPLLGLGLATYLLFALVTLPAHLITDRLAPSGISMFGVEGSIWRGSAQALQVANINIGALSWGLRPLALFTGRASADIAVTRRDGSLKCIVGYQLTSGRISISKLSGNLPISALPPQFTQGGFEGTLQANFSELVIDQGFPTVAKGSFEARNLVGPTRSPSNLGSFKVSFPASRPVPQALAGDLSSIDGPLRVTATLQLKPANRSYFIEGVIATEGNTSDELARTLQFLGAPDAQGNRPFSLEGTL